MELLPLPGFQRQPFRWAGPRPSMVDPREIPQILSEGKYVIAVKQDSKTFFVTSYHPDTPYPDISVEGLPTCRATMPDWYVNVPWETMAKMWILSYGDQLVFLDYGQEIATPRFQTIPQLNALIFRGYSRL